MGDPAEKLYPATYTDLAAVPPNKLAQIVRGTLYVLPRPAARRQVRVVFQGGGRSIHAISFGPVMPRY
jgi:hypothetical protein